MWLMMNRLFFDGMFDGDAAITKAPEAQQGKPPCSSSSDFLLTFNDY